MPNYKDLELKINYLKADEITPYVNNSRDHSKEQIEQVRSSIAEFGMCSPIGIHGGVIVYGHARFEALKQLGYKKFPCLDLGHLSEKQKKAYVIADNKMALNAGWDFDLLSAEVEALKEMDFNIELLGFSDEEMGQLLEVESEEHGGGENPYSMNIEAPTYEPSEEKPSLDSLTNSEKVMQLVNEIESSSVSEEEKQFLRYAAYRHQVFTFDKIADYYAHAGEEMQGLMEKSALIIIDYDKAIEAGFVQIKKEINGQYEGELESEQ